MQAAPQVGVWWLMLLLFGGAAGVPLGVPPEAEDPVLAKVVPETCLYYTRWAAMATADPLSPNRAEQLLAEPEVRAFAASIREAIKEGLAAGGGPRPGGPRPGGLVPLAARLGPDLITTLLTHATALFVSDARWQPGGPDVRAAMVVRLGGQRQQVQDAIDAVRPELLLAGLERITMAGSPFDRLRLGGRTVEWGIHHGYFVIGLGPGMVQGVLDRMETPAPGWLQAAETQLPVDRRATLTYCDLAALRGLMLAASREPVSDEALGALGLAHLQSYVSVTGLDAAHLVTRTRVGVDGLGDRPRPLTRDDLEVIPAAATVAVAARCDAAKVFPRLLRAAKAIDPVAFREFEQFLDALARYEMDLRKDLFPALGDVWRIYASPDTGGVLTGWIAVVSIRDRAVIERMNARLLLMFQRLAGQGPSFPRIRASRFHGETIYSLIVPQHGFLVTPSWCLADGQFLAALFPQPIKAHLDRGNEAPSLGSVPEVADRFAGEKAPTALIYRDTAALWRILYPAALLAARQMAVSLQQTGLAIDLSSVPSADVVGRHLGPSVAAVRRVDGGWQFDLQRTLPAGNAAMAAPLLGSLVLPAVQSSRQAARRTQAMNRLKQIVLAMHNFHDAYGAFPATYNTDREGKPLLSWRVHLLPMLDEGALYTQFHLDEPWDSPHNRKLIRRMPDVYLAPGSHADPGKTNYLGVTGKRGIFVPPPKRRAGSLPATGVSMREVTDGTSNTLAVVEASDALAVIWTKPDDFEPSERDPARGLVGLRRGGFLAALCDGSVRMISSHVDRKLLGALFSRDGGEAVPRP